MERNWLDRAIGWVDPQAGFQRARHRKALEVALAYDAAKIGRQTSGWATSGTSANAEISAGAAKSRERARDLVRNNPIARNAKHQFASKLVGTGINPRAATGKAALDKRLGELWRVFDAEGNADGDTPLSTKQIQWAGAMFESGDVLLRRRPRLPSDGLRLNLQVQTLEIDYLDTAHQNSGAGGYAIEGIEFDGVGRRSGYWIHAQHPGESAVLRGGTIQSKLIPAGDIAHLFEEDRPGQIRGMTRFAPVVRKLRSLDELAECKLEGRKVEACFSVFVRRNDAENGPLLGPESTEADGKRIESLEPGMIEYLRTDEDITFADPKPSAGYVEESRLWTHEVAAGLQMPYELLSGDLSQINYSSYRGSLLSFRDMIEAVRWNTFIPRVLTVIWRWFVDACFIAGLIPEINYAVEWDPPAFDLLDRLEEAKADLAEMRSGTLTWPQAVGRKGYDPAKQALEISMGWKMLDALGIVLDCNPRDRTAQGNIPSGGGTQNAIATA